MVFNPPLRNAPWRKRAPVAAKRPIARIGRKEMISSRDRCLSAIAGHRNESNSNAFFLKARTLLTRHWYPSSWRSQTKILRNAECRCAWAQEAIGSNRRVLTGFDHAATNDVVVPPATMGPESDADFCRLQATGRTMCGTCQ
jgi:hypothetical protein